MKKIYRLEALILILLTLPVSIAFSEISIERVYDNRVKTTLMIYMCGSDLESRFGAATKDINEILTSGVDKEYTNIVLMAGGSENWKCGISPDTTSVVELVPRRMLTVWRSEERLDMTESSTLTAFLDYTIEHYPADRYALIIWDHGEGPNVGICADSFSPGTYLTMESLKAALSASCFGTGNKLNWIGFDACLMATLETGYYLKDYADYMIASQETEPSTGWDYSFLKGIEHDDNALTTAQRIIDSFFTKDTGKDTLTLSCIDLGKVRKVCSALNDFYRKMQLVLTDETYPAISRERNGAKSFGRTSYDNSSDVDLVDLYELVNASETDEISASELKTAIDQMIVYNRSNVENANGISIYHPYYNKSKYTASWAETYENLFRPMSPEYERYISSFGQVLTGGQLGNWAGIDTVRSVDEYGNICFSAVLTEEQAENYNYASLLVTGRLRDVNKGMSNSYSALWRTPYIFLDEQNTLSAVYPGKAVYAVDDVTGEKLADVSYRISDDGEFLITVMYWDDSGILDPDMLNVMYRCRMLEDSPILEVNTINAYDKASRSYSSRMRVDGEYIEQNGYTEAVFYIVDRIPTYKGEELLGFDSWDDDGAFWYSNISLPRTWHFEVADHTETPELVYASFQITDTQNVTHSSKFVRVYPDTVKEYLIDGGEIIAGQLSIRPSAEYDLEKNSLCISMDITSHESDILNYSVKNIIINNYKSAASVYSTYSGENTVIINLAKEMLAGISDITDISFDIDPLLGDYTHLESQHVALHFPKPVENTAYTQPLAEGEADDLLFYLRSVTWRDDSIKLYMDIENTGEEQKKIETRFCIVEGFSDSDINYVTIEPHSMTEVTCSMYVEKSVSDSSWIVRGIATGDLLKALGVDRIKNIRMIFCDREDSYPRPQYEIRFILEQPIEYKLSEKAVHIPSVLLEDKNETELKLDRVTVFEDDGDTVLALGIWLCNHTSGEIKFSFYDGHVNGLPAYEYSGVKGISPNYFQDFDIPADALSYKFVKFALPSERAPVSVLETVDFCVSFNKDHREHIILNLQEYVF